MYVADDRVVKSCLSFWHFGRSRPKLRRWASTGSWVNTCIHLLGCFRELCSCFVRLIFWGLWVGGGWIRVSTNPKLSRYPENREEKIPNPWKYFENSIYRPNFLVTRRKWIVTWVGCLPKLKSWNNCYLVSFGFYGDPVKQNRPSRVKFTAESENTTF